jgi:hypothetical protein
VIAALGMTIKLATEALQKPTGDADALVVSTDCADAVVGIGVAIRSTDHANAECSPNCSPSSCAMGGYQSSLTRMYRAAMFGRNQPMIFTAWPYQPRHHLWRVQEVLP